MAGRAKKENFTTRWLEGLKPTANRVTHWDGMLPNFGVRVSDKGKLTFVVTRRPRGSKQLVNFIIGEYHPTTLPLKLARERAREAISILDSGKKPKDVEADRAREEALRRADTFGALAKTFCETLRAGAIPKLRGSGNDLRRPHERIANIEKELIPVWGSTMLADINKRAVTQLLSGIKTRKVAGKRGGGMNAARHTLGSIRRIFKWAVVEGYLTDDPCASIRGKDAHGTVKERDRVLEDEEIAQVWAALEVTPYPYGPLLKLLLLTGQRLRELADARWSEISGDLLKIPGPRMKGGKPHTVPLCPMAKAILDDLPRFSGGDYLFSTTGGLKPFSGFSKAKAQLDKRIGEIDKWVLHDLRRTCRTGMGAAGVAPFFAELVISHTQTGVQRIYDRNTYDAEKRDALARWEARLTSIITPPPANVVHGQFGQAS